MTLSADEGASFVLAHPDDPAAIRASGLTEAEANEVRWQHGVLWHLLDENQLGVYLAYREWEISGDPEFYFCLDIARRYGKSTIMLVVDLEDAIRRPRSANKYGANTQDAVKELVLPTFHWLVSSAPDHLRPEYRASEQAILHPNGSRTKMVGLDLYPDRLRGPHCDHFSGDEVAFTKLGGFTYVYQDVILDQFQGRPHARALLGSTPAATPGHEWSQEYVPKARARGACVHRTIDDNPRLTDEERERFIAAKGGRHAPKCRRENYAEHIVDPELAVLPEFQDIELDEGTKDAPIPPEARRPVVREHTRPPFFDAMVSIDMGYSDLCFAVLGYYDFKAAVDVVEDEVVLHRKNSGDAVAAWRAKEAELWADAEWDPNTDRRGPKRPMARIADTSLQVLADLVELHKYGVQPARNDDPEAAINDLRVRLVARKLVIHPRCVNLRAHLRYAIWKRTSTERKTFERSDAYGHFDGVAALMYFVRHLDRTKNPYPPLWHGETPATHFMPPGRVRNTPPERTDLVELRRLITANRRKR